MPDPLSEHASANPAPSVTELGPDTGGRWLVTTKSSTHIWDLTGPLTYTRLPGPAAKPMAFDSRPVTVTRVIAWPKVGKSAGVWFDEPVGPGEIAVTEQWRVSAFVLSIEPFPDGAEPPSSLADSQSSPPPVITPQAPEPFGDARDVPDES